MPPTSSAASDPSPTSDPPVGAGGRHGLAGLLNVNEVAAALRVSKMTVYRLIQVGRLPAIRVGSSLRVYRDDLYAYLTSAFPSPAGIDTWGSRTTVKSPPKT